MAVDRSSVDRLCRILRGEQMSEGELPADLLPTAEHHGVDALLAHLLLEGREQYRLTRRWETACRAVVRNEAITRSIRRVELIAVLHALLAEGVRPLLFKGAALGYTHYQKPILRPHVDVDLLVRQEEVAAAVAVFEKMGYGGAPCVTGELVRSQLPYHKLDAHGVQHVIDLHWKVSMPQTFANLLSVDELAEHGVWVPDLDPVARAVGPVHALAIACIHRVAHHHGHERLIWLYDIHLLANRLGPAQAEDILELARSKRITAVCAQGLSLAQEMLRTNMPAGLIAGLVEGKAGANAEPSALYLRPRLRRVDVLLSDLSELPSWRHRARLLKEHVFPPAAYMEHAYGVSSRALLPLLYAWRFVDGARGWFRRDGD